MTKIRKKFVERFGEKEARRVEQATETHAPGGRWEMGGNSGETASDYFQFCLLSCIDYECFSKEEYRKQHGFEAPWQEISEWIKAEGDLENYQGEPPSYLGLLSGAFNDFVRREQ